MSAEPLPPWVAVAVLPASPLVVPKHCSGKFIQPYR
jgi:hypothetical protein